ncbi:MAG: putative sugar nucleotidyl transferase, partial [Phycisphaerae bacterium]
MAAIYVWEDARFEQLYPLTYLRPAYLLRAGLGTLLEHIRRAVPSAPAGVMARSLLAPLVAMETDLPINPKIVTKAGVLLINGRWFATGPLTMPEGTAGVVGDDWVWLHL